MLSRISNVTHSDLTIGNAGITAEQREKFKEQRGQYLEANEKLEAQLMKLKEQREELKERGAKHEDDIMKENARLQVCMPCYASSRMHSTQLLQLVARLA